MNVWFLDSLTSPLVSLLIKHQTDIPGFTQHKVLNPTQVNYKRWSYPARTSPGYRRQRWREDLKIKSTSRNIQRQELLSLSYQRLRISLKTITYQSRHFRLFYRSSQNSQLTEFQNWFWTRILSRGFGRKERKNWEK